MNRADSTGQADIRADADDPRTTHIDVRGLPRPQPLIQILQLLQRLPDDATVIVHHDRDPLGLYPELAQIGWWAETVPGDSGEVRLRLRRGEG